MVDEQIELPASQWLRYVAFVDPSGGSYDSMTLAIAQMKTKKTAALSLRLRGRDLELSCKCGLVLCRELRAAIEARCPKCRGGGGNDAQQRQLATSG